jgi:hypothetical protein
MLTYQTAGVLPACPKCGKCEGGKYYECIKCGRTGHVVSSFVFGGNGCIRIDERCPAGEGHDFRKLNDIRKG